MAETRRGSGRSREPGPALSRMRPIIEVVLLSPAAWSTSWAASSASLRSVLRGVPISARMVRPRRNPWLGSRVGHRKIGRDFARADRVPETTFYQRRAACGGLLQELPDLCIVHHGATQIGRQPRADPFRSHFRRRTSESPRSSCGDFSRRSAFAARAPSPRHTL